jgi:hypothetical protein
VVEWGLADNTAQLLTERTRLEGDAIVSVLNHYVELLGWRRRRRFIGDRHMFGQLGLTAQAAVGGVLAMVGVCGLGLRRPPQRE